jgi:hypothetical protein
LIRWSAGREKRESKMQGSGVASLPHFEQISSIDPRHTPTDLRPPQSSKCPARSSSVKRRLSIIQRLLEFNFRSVPFTFSDVVITSCTLRRIAGLAPSHLGLWRPPKIRSYVIFLVSQARIAPEVLPPCGMMPRYGLCGASNTTLMQQQRFSLAPASFSVRNFLRYESARGLPSPIMSILFLSELLD